MGIHPSTAPIRWWLFFWFWRWGGRPWQGPSWRGSNEAAQEGWDSCDGGRHFAEHPSTQDVEPWFDWVTLSNMTKHGMFSFHLEIMIWKMILIWKISTPPTPTHSPTTSDFNDALTTWDGFRFRTLQGDVFAPNPYLRNLGWIGTKEISTWMSNGLMYWFQYSCFTSATHHRYCKSLPSKDMPGQTCGQTSDWAWCIWGVGSFDIAQPSVPVIRSGKTILSHFVVTIANRFGMYHHWGVHRINQQEQI